MPLLTPTLTTTTQIQKRDPIRLGTCHKEGVPDRPDFPCYRWFWTIPYGEGFQQWGTPHLECMCGGSYPTVPSDGIPKPEAELNVSVADNAVMSVDDVVDQVLRDGGDSPDAQVKGEIQAMLQSVPTRHPHDLVPRSDEDHREPRYDWSTIIAVILCIAVFTAVVLGINYSHQKRRRAEIERRRNENQNNV